MRLGASPSPGGRVANRRCTAVKFDTVASGPAALRCTGPLSSKAPGRARNSYCSPADGRGGKVVAVSPRLAKAHARAVVALVGATLLLPACGAGRSTEAFCDTLEAQVVELRSKYTDRAGMLDSEGDPLAALLVGLGSLVEAQGDLVVMFDRLEGVAPDDIQPEVAAVRESLQRQLDAAGESVGDPLGGLGSSLVAGVSAMGSYAAVQNYISSNCDLSFMAGS